MNAGREAAATAALRIADALADPVEVARGLPADRRHTLCDGLAGTALLHALLAGAVPGAAARARAHWRLTAATLGDARPDGVYRGPGGLAASLLAGAEQVSPAERPGDAAGDAVRGAVRWLSARTEVIAGRPWPGPAPGSATCPWPVYDVMSGLSGTGRVLLAAYGAGAAAEAAPGLMAAQSALTRMVLGGTPDRPGWWQPGGRLPGPAAGHPEGAAVTGTAHGIAGPLALLALAETTGPAMEGRRTAVRAAADWLVTVQENDSWPPRATAAAPRPAPASGPGTALGTGPGTGVGSGRRDAWCYGAPGIARALALASTALGDPAYARLADLALTALAERPGTAWDTDGAGLCHGSAGVLVCALRAGHRSLAESAARRTLCLASGPWPGSPGFPDAAGSGLGLLGGAAGTALALAQYAGLLPPSSRVPWDCLLLTV
ncbi:lanthionine synthetase LanC family protein [Streptomyces erythrochromogenes]|uniref:lanthionine synthetase LanC family protein n=1 Tax=Streptomyces erythrochromogenes TaxID=285574 RepID=UPI00382A42EF